MPSNRLCGIQLAVRAGGADEGSGEDREADQHHDSLAVPHDVDVPVQVAGEDPGAPTSEIATA